MHTFFLSSDQNPVTLFKAIYRADQGRELIHPGLDQDIKLLIEPATSEWNQGCKTALILTFLGVGNYPYQAKVRGAIAKKGLFYEVDVTHLIKAKDEINLKHLIDQAPSYISVIQYSSDLTGLVYIAYLHNQSFRLAADVTVESAVSALKALYPGLHSITDIRFITQNSSNYPKVKTKDVTDRTDEYKSCQASN